MRRPSMPALLAFATLLAPLAARAQAPGGGGPPAVGVTQAHTVAVTQSSDFVGRVQAINRVALVARVTAYLDRRLFTEGAEMHRGDVLYQLEQPPFQAAVEAAQGSVGQYQAQLRNAAVTLTRAQSLLNTPAGQQSTVDAALAGQQSYAAQVLSAQAQLEQAQINLGYTVIRAPIDGQISATAVTEGNVVSPGSGQLATMVSLDPEYVLFSVALRDALDLRERYATKGGFDAVVIRLRLPTGKLYASVGKLDYAAPTVATSTDTLTLRAVMPNPLLPGAKPGQAGSRELVDGEFVTVQVQGAQPIQVLAIPRAAVMSDVQGDYVYRVAAGNKAEIARVTLGQQHGTDATVLTGLAAGDTVVAEGLQRVHPGQPVAPGPLAPSPAPAMQDAAAASRTAPAETPAPGTGAPAPPAGGGSPGPAAGASPPPSGNASSH